MIAALVGGDAGVAVKVTREGPLGEVFELALHILRLNEVELDELDFLAVLLGLVEAEEHGFDALQVEEGVAHQDGIGFGKRDQMRLVRQKRRDHSIAALRGIEVFQAEEFGVDLLAGRQVEGAAAEHDGSVLVNVARRDRFDKTSTHFREHDAVETEEAFEGEDRLGLRDRAAGIEIDLGGGDVLTAEDDFSGELFVEFNDLQGGVVAQDQGTDFGVRIGGGLRGQRIEDAEASEEEAG